MAESGSSVLVYPVLFRGHPFDRACRRHGIEHRLTKPNHPWTNGQVERMNRTISYSRTGTWCAAR